VTENQDSIVRWINQTFGPAEMNMRCATRANEEMAELLKALSTDDDHPKAVEEAADIVIVLYRLASRFGVNLHDEIDKKMAINRARTWKRDGTGQGYHVKQE
jgi:NTP pyrophosphatase (non-canonical NTP hydrolase)